MPTRLITVPKAAWKKGVAYAGAHTFIATIVGIIVLWGGYHVYGKVTAPSTATRYVTTTVATGTVVASLTETGQVAASQQVSLSPKASGEVIGVYVKPGDQVYAGQVIAQLDASDAVAALQNAKLSLQHAELSYQQTTSSTTLALNLVVAQNSVTTAEISEQKAHDDAYASIASMYSDLGTIVTGLDSALHDSTVQGRTNQQNSDAFADLVSSHDASISIYKNSAETSYTAALAAYNTGLASYKQVDRSISNDDLLALAKSTYTTVETVAEAVKDSHDFFDRVNNDYSLYNLGSSNTLTGLLASSNTYSNTVSSDLSTALSTQSNLVGASQSLAQAQNSLQTIQGGSNTLTIQSADISLQSAKDAVTNAQTTVDNYSVFAPFAGTIASVGVKKYDQAGSGTAVATLVTNQETASISVNEVDASKIKVGQKAMLSFDALPDVTIAGTVASINMVGTASQGVVSYDVIITFDTPNASVLPGMSVTANIITASESGLVVPASAIKAGGGGSYVQVFSPPLVGSESASGATSDVPPTEVTVTTGLTDDTKTIVETGLSAGTEVVSQTVSGTSAAATTKTTTPSLFGGGGGARAGGATFRAVGGGG